MTTETKRLKVEYGADQHEIFKADSASVNPNQGLEIKKDLDTVGEFAPGRWSCWYYID